MVNPLAANLVMLGGLFFGIATYIGITFVWRKQSEERDKAFSFFLLGLGFYSLFYGLFESTTWPFPGGYSILFGDTYAVLGFLSVASGLTIWKKGNIEFIGIFAFFAGLYALFSGIAGYQLNLTKSPLDMFGMYLGAGGAGILMLPFAFTRNRIIGILIMIALVAGAVLALITGFSAIKEHIESYLAVVLPSMIG